MNVFNHHGFYITQINPLIEEGVFEIIAQNFDGAKIVSYIKNLSDAVPSITKEIDDLYNVLI